jgi:type II secretory ATPase GspE/PulE/Tfp pilus assembly ATPase PilB-like protein
MAIYEVFSLDEEIRRMVMSGAPEMELQMAAERRGMRSLRESALIAVRAGLTTPEEMGRVVLAAELDPAPLCSESV